MVYIQYTHILKFLINNLHINAHLIKPSEGTLQLTVMNYHFIILAADGCMPIVISYNSKPEKQSDHKLKIITLINGRILCTIAVNDAADKSSVNSLASSFTLDQPQDGIRYLCVQVTEQIVSPHH